MISSDEKIYIKEAPERLNITQSKLYRVMKKIGIKPKKDGKKSYLEKDKMREIYDFLHNSGKSETDLLSEKLKKEEIKNELLREKIAELEIKNDKVFYEMGKQTEIIQVLQKKNKKLLTIEVLKQKEEKKGFFARIFGK
jgi:hypothetical protein